MRHFFSALFNAAEPPGACRSYKMSECALPVPRAGRSRRPPVGSVKIGTRPPHELVGEETWYLIAAYLYIQVPEMQCCKAAKRCISSSMMTLLYDRDL